MALCSEWPCSCKVKYYKKNYEPLHKIHTMQSCMATRRWGREGKNSTIWISTLKRYTVYRIWSDAFFPWKLIPQITPEGQMVLNPAKYTFLIIGCVSSSVTTYEAGNTVSDQLYTLVTLPPVPTGWEGGWSLNSVVERNISNPSGCCTPVIQRSAPLTHAINRKSSSVKYVNLQVLYLVNVSCKFDVVLTVHRR